ncbi:hypothetical protein [Hungatella hathewayi]|uniref:hypothetical protein n=1 Tax=Hungatella hathewayi TaxID=154046 RepID=UPI0035680B82
MNFCNTFKVKSVDPSERRKAPAIPVTQFCEYLTDYYNMNAGLGDAVDYITDATEKDEFIKNIMRMRGTKDCKGFYSEFKFITDTPASSAIKSVDSESSLLGIHVLPNKIPFYGFLLGGELEKPYFAIMYYNGSVFRVFIPEAGNTINSDFYTAFGSEAYNATENPGDIISAYESFLRKSLEEIKCSKIPEDELEYWQPSIAYCLKHGYATNEENALDIMNTISWKSILEDITAFIEESDEPEASSTVLSLEEEDDDYDEDEDEDEEEYKYSYLSEEEEEEPKDDSDEDEEETHTTIVSASEEDDEYETLEVIPIVIPVTELDEALSFRELEKPKTTLDNDFCNMKRSMIRLGKLSLPRIIPEMFKQKLNEYCDSMEHVLFDYTINPIILAKNVMSASELDIEVDFATIKASESIIKSKTGKPLLGFNILPNGIPFFGLEVGETADGEQQSLFVALLWNGSDIISYIPSFGNTFNTDLYTVFDKEPDNDTVKKCRKIYEKINKGPIEWDKKGMMTKYYFKSKGCETENIDELKHAGSWNGILEDLCFAVTIQNK